MKTTNATSDAVVAARLGAGSALTLWDPSLHTRRLLVLHHSLSMSAAPAASPLSLDDPRLGDYIRTVTLEQFPEAIKSSSSTASPSSARLHVAFTGFPYDEGCRRNGGRVGAEDGPEVVRKFVHKMGTLINPEFNVDLRTIGLYDLGDVSKGSTLEAAHTALEQRVRSILDADSSVIPFVVGGSNDQSYPNAAALMGHLGHGDIGVINIDAHFDVRPLKNGLAHSGSPFRQLLEDVRFSKQLTPPAANSQPQYRFIEYAAQGSQCSKEHADYLLKAGNGQSKIYWVNDPIDEFKHSERPLGGSARAQHFADVLHRMGGQALFVSFDLDAVTGADAPGVSCPGTIGLSAHDALFMAYSAGLNPRVRLFDLSEFNPKFDEYRTGRLVANMFYYFCLGVAGRKQPATS